MKIASVITIAALIMTIPLSVWSKEDPNAADIFKTRCAACHGDQGQGFPNLKIPPVKGTQLTVEKLVAFLLKGEGGKTVHATPIVNIDANEAKAIAEYVKNLK